MECTVVIVDLTKVKQSHTLYIVGGHQLQYRSESKTWLLPLPNISVSQVYVTHVNHPLPN